MTKSRWLAGVASVALFAGPAMAADVPTFAPAPIPAPMGWTGGYVGITAGGAWGAFGTATSTAVNPGNFFSDPAIVGIINAAGSNSIKPGGFATGIEAGYNWQNGSFLLGVEADFQALHFNGALDDFQVDLAIHPALRYHAAVSATPAASSTAGA